MTQLEEALQDDYTVIRQDITRQTLLYQLLHMDGTLSSAMFEHGKLIKRMVKRQSKTIEWRNAIWDSLTFFHTE